MKLYFLRHGIAEDADAGILSWGVPAVSEMTDFNRRLTAEGLKEMRAVAQGMRKLELRFDVILASPLVRARQTAEIVARGLNAERRLQEEPRLACGCGFGPLVQMVDGHGPRAHVLLVGHEPDFSTLVHELTGGAVRMGKASLACVDCPEVTRGGGELRWLLKADHLALIGES
jgi:phosphohistidine phosphatase